MRKVASLSFQILRALRVYQWSKNLLVFLPLVFAHVFFSVEHLRLAFFAFFSFSFLASAAYVLNDLVDINSDREHPTKCKRPFASGALPKGFGYLLIPLLCALSGVFAWQLPRAFAVLLIIYLVVNLAYSFVLKRKMMIDVVCLAFLYTLRVYAGGAATSLAVSEWLLTYAIFFFFSLALIKRHSEIIKKESDDEAKLAGRGYYTSDKLAIFILGVASSLISVLVFALYINSPKVMELYRAPERLWLLSPLLLYWVGRLWLKASRDEIHEDPVVFVILDHATWAIGALGCAVLWWAI